MKFLAVEGCEIDHSAGSVISGGVFSITSVASAKMKEDSKGVYKTPLSYTFAGGNATGFIAGTVLTIVPQSINATALKNKAEGPLVMRVEDSGQMVCIGTLDPTPPPPASPTGPVSGGVEIADAGQSKVRGD